MNRDRSDEEWAESLNYHNKCLEMLIPILSNLDHELTEDVLAAVAILRLDEEMESKHVSIHFPVSSTTSNSGVLTDVATHSSTNPPNF